ncbi:MAG: hypothetical protein HWN79_14695 [Candidatus Lokiarchaeota archaeon]|nr:hypothetical protein [Candidatus Lokiarchaeota archaeon]
MNDEKIREDLKRLRIQARSRVIMLISSLILIFLWFTNLSWITDQETFSSGAMAAFAHALGMKTYYIIPATFIITVLFTIFYLILLKVLISSSTKNLRKF